MLQQFLSIVDTDRALRSLGKLARHDTHSFALTGGLAIEIHLLLAGRAATPRTLNDIDFVTDSFRSIPGSLAHDFIFRHVHPTALPGKTLIQFIDLDAALRLDVFRAQGSTMSRTSTVDLPCGTFCIVSAGDLAARAARLALDLAEGVSTPVKHARDFLRLLELVDQQKAEIAWHDHRKPQHPTTFAHATARLQELVPVHPELLIVPEYSRDINAVCPRCAPTSQFPLANPALVLDSLGYC